MHATVAGPVCGELEGRFTDRPITRQEGAHRVVRAKGGSERLLRVHGRSRATVRRKGVTAYAAIEIETRPETAGIGLELLEGGLPVEEKSRLIRRQSRYRISEGIGADCGPEAGIRRGCVRSGRSSGPTQ